MKKSVILFTGLLFLTVFSSCEKILDMEVKDTDKKVVLNSIFSAGAPMTVHLSLSKSILDTGKYDNINQATVYVYENSKFFGILPLVQNGIYFSNSLIPSEGKTYKILVYTDSYPEVNASDEIPTAVLISSMDTLTVTKTISNIYGEAFTDVFLECTIRFKDPGTQKNYYMLTVRKTNYDSVKTDYFINVESQDLLIEEWIQSPDYENNKYGAIFSDHKINGNAYSLSILVSHEKMKADTCILNFFLNSISENYYYYCITYLKFREAKNNPFSEPVLVFSNISDGYGIFAGHSFSVDSVEIKGQY